MDSFTGYYSRERKERNLAPAKGGERFSPASPMCGGVGGSTSLVRV